MTSGDCGDESGDRDGTYLGHGKEWRRSSELLEYLDEVVYEDSWWLSVGCLVMGGKNIPNAAHPHISQTITKMTSVFRASNGMSGCFDTLSSIQKNTGKSKKPTINKA
jgi:hypothetical protein